MGGELQEGLDAFRDHGLNFYRDGMPMYNASALGMLSVNILEEAGLAASTARELAQLNDRSDSFALVIERIKNDPSI